MFREYFQKRRVHKLLSKFVTPNILNEVTSKQTQATRELIEKQIEFVCIAVRGETPEIISQRMGIVAELAVSHKAMVDNMFSGIVIVTFGIIDFDSSRDRDGLSIAILKELQENAKFIYGSTIAHCGNIGSPRLMAFSFVIPGFLDVLSELRNLPFGEKKEWK